MDAVSRALAQCETICELIDDDVPEHAWDKAADFFEDVRDKVVSVSETIDRTKRVTPVQASALDNWEEGVRRWLP